MRHTTIQGFTRDLGKPRDWDEARQGPCGSLPIRDEVHHNTPVMLSQWKPDANDLAVLNAGGVIELCICGTTHPPVSVIVTKE